MIAHTGNNGRDIEIYLIRISPIIHLKKFLVDYVFLGLTILQE